MNYYKALKEVYSNLDLVARPLGWRLTNNAIYWSPNVSNRGWRMMPDEFTEAVLPQPFDIFSDWEVLLRKKWLKEIDKVCR